LRMGASSRQIANIGNRDDVLLIARSAVTGAADATPLVRALLLERLAWAVARNHDTTPACPRRCRRRVRPTLGRDRGTGMGVLAGPRRDRRDGRAMPHRTRRTCRRPPPTHPEPSPATTTATSARSRSTRPGSPKATPRPATSTPPAPSWSTQAPRLSTPTRYDYVAASTPSPT
jgi:hypothetical protein